MKTNLKTPFVTDTMAGKPYKVKAKHLKLPPLLAGKTWRIPLKNKIIYEWIKSHPEDISSNILLKNNLESLATIDDDALQKRFLKRLIQNYVLLEKKVDALLKNTLPETVAEELKLQGHFQPRPYNCTILFTDFVEFTALSEVMEESVLVETLNTIFTEFDINTNKFKGTKIKTIGDAYMAIFGAPAPYENHAIKAIKAAFAMLNSIETFNLTSQHPFHMRVGIHSGQVMAGVVGKERMQFDVFGDGVNIASRFESSGEKNKINVSETTYRLAETHFEFESRGPIALKHKKNMNAYFAIREKQTKRIPT